jgi:hypothetical protein
MFAMLGKHETLVLIPDSISPSKSQTKSASNLGLKTSNFRPSHEEVQSKSVSFLSMSAMCYDGRPCIAAVSDWYKKTRGCGSLILDFYPKKFLFS